jgi:hypothetical protein
MTVQILVLDPNTNLLLSIEDPRCTLDFLSRPFSLVGSSDGLLYTFHPGSTGHS